MASDGIARFMDFTEETPPIRFKVGEETFTAVSAIPLARISELSKLGSTAADGSTMVQGIERIFSNILVPESYERFIAGLSSTENPIGIAHVTKILPWLMEQYGLRPTEASSGSVDSLSETGASLTDGLSVEDATYAQ
jgi:hypothetical protein